jgi:hypothetical protein
LSGKGKGAKGKKPRGGERKKLWEDVKALRKEYASTPSLNTSSNLLQFLGIDDVKEEL